MDLNNNVPRYMLAALLLCLFHITHMICLGADTISANQSLSGVQTIVSAGGIFELGFHKPGNSSNYYICMWYKQIPFDNIVWIANREKPVSDRFSSVLRISNGNLVLFNESQIPIWSTNVSSTTSTSVHAVLQDDGNLVLIDELKSPSLLWQSFDNPAHAWLPGSKLGYNNTTRRNQPIISWKNSEDPTPGLFSVELDQSDNSFRIVWNRSKIYWTTGAWNGKVFEKVPEMKENNIFYYSFITEANKSSLTYFVKDNSTFRYTLMDISGQVKQVNWLGTNIGWSLFWAQPRQQCEVYAFCGAFGSCNQKSLPFCNCLKGFVPKSQSDWNLEDYSGGCKRKNKLQCGNNMSTNGANHNGERDKFLPLSSMSLPESAQSATAADVEECESTCLNDCSCTAYAYNSSTCSIWIGDLINLKQLSVDDRTGKSLYVRLAASELQSKKNNIVIGIVLGAVAGFTVLVGLIVLVILIQRNKIVGLGKAVVEGSLVAFDYRYLQNATKNFSEKLGGGGFGSVFKGTLPADSTLVAVKRLESVSQGEKQFRTEVSTIGTIQHVNLAMLRGFCCEGTKRLLVYDYMPNGSLASHLFRINNSNVLDWKTRYQIALGTARGLFYLHEKCRDCIIHCDIKPDNILLDAEFHPKLADFGLAKLFGRDFSRVLTTVRGTRGYLAPEWISGEAITTKADVYSYGMMLFEFVSGRRNSEHFEEGEVDFFPNMAAKVIIEGGDVVSLLDPRLEGNADEDELIRVCRVACWCIQDDETHRPSMGHIVQILEGIINVNLPPLPKIFQVFMDNPDDIIFFTESSSSQKVHRHGTACPLLPLES
ncbi:hypothetical protein FNV43_RR13498 [Rhamnella rubrinervis]|uniref:Receptor-like serine/threonine-protein kinase n=1 Tax=Rhamnella rubrinervis TaxID=2594499 RepID=A0A8K0H1A2_9ROSA|nr:hypothetical protein FNV43_RR13498 [Rhamnella rubrinervis]